jgi:hypothetical protein
MTRELNHTGAFVVFEIHSRRIIKLHNHHKTALNQILKLGKDSHAIKPVADRFFYQVGGFV